KPAPLLTTADMSFGKRSRRRNLDRRGGIFCGFCFPVETESACGLPHIIAHSADDLAAFEVGERVSDGLETIAWPRSQYPASRSLFFACNLDRVEKPVYIWSLWKRRKAHNRRPRRSTASRI